MIFRGAEVMGEYWRARFPNGIVFEFNDLVCREIDWQYFLSLAVQNISWLAGPAADIREFGVDASCSGGFEGGTRPRIGHVMLMLSEVRISLDESNRNQDKQIVVGPIKLFLEYHYAWWDIS